MSIFKKEIEFWGHHIGPEGLTSTTTKEHEINEFPEQIHSKSLRRFLGIVNFYRKLAPGVADILLPVTELLKSTHKTRPYSTPMLKKSLLEH